MKNKNAQTIKYSFENFIISSKRSANLLEGDRDRGVCNSIVQSFLNENKIELYSRNKSLGAGFAERFILYH